MIYRPVIQPVYRPLIRSVLRPRRDGDDLAFDLTFADGTMQVARGGVVPSFSRASQDTRFNQAGIVEIVPAGTPAVDWVPALGGWAGRFEEQVTNLSRDSESLANWTGNNGSIATDSSVPNIYGGAGAQVFTPNVTNSTHYASVTVSYMTVQVSTIYTISAFLKDVGDGVAQICGGGAVFGQNVWANFVLSDAGSIGSVGSEVLGSGIEALANGWYRCWIRGASLTNISGTVLTIGGTGNLSTRARLGVYLPTANMGVAVQGVQFETGGLSSYVPTNGAAGVRQADVPGVPSAGWWSGATGTFLVECGVYAGSVTTAARDVIQIGSANDRLLIRASNTIAPTYPQGFMGTGSGLVGGNAGTTPAGAVEKFALSYDGTVGRFSRNGTVSAAFGGFTGAGGPNMTLGQAGGINQINGYIRRVRYWRRLMSAAELAALTAL